MKLSAYSCLWIMQVRRSNMISNLSFISSSNRFVGYCVSTPFCCGLIWLNFIVISKHQSYLNVSIFQEEITLLSLWNGKRVVIFISPVLHSESYYPKMITNDDTCNDKNSNYQTNWNNRSRKPKTNHTQPASTQTMKTGKYIRSKTVDSCIPKNLLSKNISEKPTHAKDESPAVGRPRDLRNWRANISLYSSDHHFQITTTPHRP